MGGSSESFTTPSSGGVDVTVIFEGPTSTSRMYVAGGGGTSLRASGFSEKLFRLQCVLRMIAHPLGLQLELSSTFELGDQGALQQHHLCVMATALDFLCPLL